jgi:hypothetical protein
VLVVPAAGWFLAALARTGACVLQGLRASIWGSHIETPYKKEQLKKAMPFAIYGGPAAGRLPVLCLLLVLLVLVLLVLLLLLRARCSLCCCCCCCCCCSCCSFFYCY